MDESFDVSEAVETGYSQVSVKGEVDVATAPAFREVLDVAIGRGAPVIVVDLLAVTFIDSTGLGVLVGAHKRCDEAGRAMRILVSEPRILKVFEITGLTEVFSIVRSLAEATAP